MSVVVPVQEWFELDEAFFDHCFDHCDGDDKEW